jgi:hypothetical protein
VSRSPRLRAGIIGVLLGIALVPIGTTAASAAPTVAMISGEIEQLTLNNPADVWSGGWVRVGGQYVVLPRNLLMDLPANRLSLQQLFAAAPKACVDRRESGLAKSDVCNTAGTGGFASITANRTNAGDVIAGDVLLEKGRELVSGTVTAVNVDDGYFRVNGTTGVADSGVLVRLNDPTGRHTVQQGKGCAAATTGNCSPDPRFMLDPDNYTNAFSTGYPLCLPSTVARPYTDKLDLNANGNTTEQLTAQARPDGSGDTLCPETNRPASNVAADSRRLAPLLVGDHVTVRGNFETVAGTRFLSAFSTKVGTALSTGSGPDQPDYMSIDEMFMDAPAFQRLRIRDQFIGATTEADSDVVLYSVHRDPATNAAHEFPLGTVAGCEAAAGPLTCRRVLGPNTFRVRHDTLLTTAGAKNTKLSACGHLNADPRFTNLHVCPQGGTAAEEFGILSPLPHEIQARTGRKLADAARADGGVLKTMDLGGHDATNGQFLFPMGINLGGIETPNFAEIDINKLGTPTSFDGMPWNLDRRLSPNGCVGACESTPQPLDPFPFGGFDPRTQSSIPEVPYTDPNYTASPLGRTPDRILSYVDPALGNFNGDATVLNWPPVDPGPVGPPPAGPPPINPPPIDPPPVAPPPPAPPAITGYAPSNGPPGTAVVISGSNLLTASGVTFGGVAATSISAGSTGTTVTAIVPDGGKTGPISVTTAGGAAASATLFEVTPVTPPPAPPTITGFTPTSGPVGTQITITGTDFALASSVTIGGKPAVYQQVATGILAVVPAGAVTGKVTVSTPLGGTGTSTTVFTVTAAPPPNPTPTVTAFTPASGGVGTTVTVIGTNLAGSTAVTVNGTPGTSVVVTSGTQLTFVVGAGSTTGRIRVQAPGGIATSATNFTVVAAPTITSFSPSSGNSGTKVVIKGRNLTGATAVTVNGTPARSFHVDSASQISFVVGTGTTAGLIKVQTRGGTATSASRFTVSGRAK